MKKTQTAITVVAAAMLFSCSKSSGDAPGKVDGLTEEAYRERLLGYLNPSAESTAARNQAIARQEGIPEAAAATYAPPKTPPQMPEHRAPTKAEGLERLEEWLGDAAKLVRELWIPSSPPQRMHESWEVRYAPHPDDQGLTARFQASFDTKHPMRDLDRYWGSARWIESSNFPTVSAELGDPLPLSGTIAFQHANYVKRHPDQPRAPFEIRGAGSYGVDVVVLEVSVRLPLSEARQAVRKRASLLPEWSRIESACDLAGEILALDLSQERVECGPFMQTLGSSGEFFDAERANAECKGESSRECRRVLLREADEAAEKAHFAKIFRAIGPAGDAQHEDEGQWQEDTCRSAGSLRVCRGPHYRAIFEPVSANQ